MYAIGINSKRPGRFWKPYGLRLEELPHLSFKIKFLVIYLPTGQVGLFTASEERKPMQLKRL
jgi:hypothetical protein